MIVALGLCMLAMGFGLGLITAAVYLISDSDPDISITVRKSDGVAT